MAFHDHTENGITVLQSDLLCGSIRHGFSTRTGGVSPAPWDSLNLGVGRGDDPANVQENFRRLPCRRQRSLRAVCWVCPISGRCSASRSTRTTSVW